MRALPVEQKNVHRYLRDDEMNDVDDLEGENRDDVILDEPLLLGAGQGDEQMLLALTKILFGEGDIEAVKKEQKLVRQYYSDVVKIRALVKILPFWH